MKKILKESLLLLIISLFTFILLPCTINAQNKELDYKTIYEKTNIELEENLTITSLEFKNNADNSSLSYGITALIYNSSSSNYQIDSTIAQYIIITNHMNYYPLVVIPKKFPVINM